MAFILHIGQLIKASRAFLGVRQGRLAHACGISQVQLSRIENGHNTPSPELLVRLIEGLAGGG